jgi:toxin-antitoxin system PIN domain toxin
LIDLLDVNVWVALSSEDHPHHERALIYWNHEAGERIALCRISALGFLRLTTNSAVMGGRPHTSEDAWRAYLRLRATPEVLFADEPTGCDAALATLVSSAPISSKHWTDAYLAAFAIAGEMRFVTFDAGFARFPRLHQLHLRS